MIMRSSIPIITRLRTVSFLLQIQTPFFMSNLQRLYKMCFVYKHLNALEGKTAKQF
jgi:hypothetical protein